MEVRVGGIVVLVGETVALNISARRNTRTSPHYAAIVSESVVYFSAQFKPTVSQNRCNPGFLKKRSEVWGLGPRFP